MKQRRWTLTFAASVLLAIPSSSKPTAFAQATNTGTVVGVVTDPNGAVIPDASISVIDTTTNSERKTTTNPTGQYVFTNVPPGTYNIVIAKVGFASTRVESQPVAVGTQTTLNARLRVGDAKETIEVDAAGVQLQTLNSTIGSALESEAIAALPSSLHDAGTFTELQPGVSPDGSVAGAVVDQSTFMLDGGNNSNDMDGTMSGYTPSYAGDPTGIEGGGGPTGVIPTPQDSIEEFKVNIANQTADFNSSAGAQVEVVTKRGKDRFFGTAYEYYLDNNFSGNTWDNNLSGTPVPSYHYNKFGAGVGGPLLPRLLGGKTYFFGLYQGWRFPQSATYERSVPSENLKNGLVTFNGTNYDLKAIDPRGIGVSPIVQQLWSQYEPTGNDPSCGALLGDHCDGVNEIGYKANMALPENDNFFVGRIDHDFGDNWHWMTSYRYYKLTRATNNQVDIGGFFKGDKFGVPTAISNRPQQPWYLVTGLTTSITQSLTNDFHFSFLRNFWQWQTSNAPPQIVGLGGALEPLGETPIGVLAPFNVDSGSIRTRFWNGHDYFFRDDLTYLLGKHLVQFGGQFQRNWDYHQRTDNGGGINYTTTYQLGDGTGSGLIDLSSLGGGFPAFSVTASRIAAAAYGMVTDSQVAYTRSGSNLQLNPPLSPAFDKSTILFYNVYFTDAWHLKPSFTVSYGLGWTLEMPPTEEAGKQVVLVDDANNPIGTESYLAQRKNAAMQGGVYNPVLGFALVGNVGKGLKYPYNPFYGSFSPRVAAAWNPHFNGDSVFARLFRTKATVIRGGYGHQYGRLNGADLVAAPLLGVGLIQAVQCRQVFASGVCGPNNPTASTAFRVGVDGTTAPLPAASPTLPQPAYPGINSIAGSAAYVVDPSFRPNEIHSLDLTIQRQVHRTTLVEIGYIGRIIRHEFQPININAVPYMMTSGTQNFANAYAALEKALGCTTSAGACGAAVPSATINTSGGSMPNPAYAAYINGIAASAPQSFFETSLNPSYCSGTFSNGTGLGYANFTAAVIDNELSNLLTQSVWSAWSDLDNGNFNFPRSMENTPIPGSALGGSGQMSSGVALISSIGYGNYNGGFITVKTNDWHGLTLQQNFTYSKALGTGAFPQAVSEYTANDPFNLHKMYGLQGFHRKLVYNTYAVAKEPWFKNQAGLAGRLAGGWQLAPILTAGSGAPLYCSTQTGAQAFGSADGSNFGTNEQCVFTTPYKGGNSSHYNVTGGADAYGNSVGTAVAGPGSASVNMFKDPVAVWNQVRAPILGIDTRNSGVGPITGMPYWNVDMSVLKNFRITERASFEYSMIFTNVFNHNVLADPNLSLGTPSVWGVLSSQLNQPRNMEFGLRVRF
jgi:hypothetical protein